jgi:hypothetical protein
LSGHRLSPPPFSPAPDHATTWRGDRRSLFQVVTGPPKDGDAVNRYLDLTAPEPALTGAGADRLRWLAAVLFAHFLYAMSYLTMKDGTHIFYKDWGTGTPAVFSHGWPLNADA